MKKPAGEPLVILLVEDNESHAELVLRSMREYRVANIIYVAENGEKALDFLFHRAPYEKMKTSPRPNLILLDLRLPRVDGLEVLKTIKETPQLMQIPVVVLTSSDAETDIARSYDYHANSYVVKPLDFRKFTQLMQDIGAFWLGWNTVPLSKPDREFPGAEIEAPPVIPL
jgi:CheY-like chemotaxis protein